MGKTQSTGRLMVAHFEGREIRDQNRLGVPSQRVLQQERQFGVPVGNVRRPLLELHNDHAQCAQAFVDIGGLLQSASVGIGGFLALASGQVHQVQGGLSHVGHIALIDFDDDVTGQHTVAPAGLLVEFGLGGVPVAGAYAENLEDVLHCRKNNGTERNAFFDLSFKQ